jgi:hypothetical protein
MTGSPGRPAAAGQHSPATPALLPYGYLLAALALLLLAPPALAGWVAGAWVVRGGWVSRGRLAAAGGVTGALALLVIGHAGRRPPPRCRGRSGRRPAGHPDRWGRAGGPGPDPGPWAGVGRGHGPVGVAIATIPPSQDLAVRPEWTAQERRRRVRAEARDRRRAERLAQSPRVAASHALGVALDPTPALPSWRRGRLVVPPAGQLGLTTLLVSLPGTGKSTAAERLAYLAAQQRRAICVIDGKGTDGLAAAVLAAWPEARIRSFPEHPVDLWRATPQQMADRLVAAWRFSDEAEFYEQAAMLGLRLALTAPGPACSTPWNWSPDWIRPG